MSAQFRKFSILFVVLFFVKHSSAQSNVTFDAGQVFSTYKYTDSQGNTEKDLTSNITGCFSLGYQYVKYNGLFIRTNMGMRKAGASMTVDEMNISWNVQYADANIGLGYMFNKWRLKPYFSASPYFAYMLRANQTIGPDNYDILKNKSLKTTDYGLFLSPGFKIALSNYISFYAEYKYILGLQNLENSSNQQSFNRGFSINLGVAVTIIKYKYITTH
jgi:hypothetical protein